MKFSEGELLETIQKARPGQTIYFDGVSASQMNSALKGITELYNADFDNGALEVASTDLEELTANYTKGLDVLRQGFTQAAQTGANGNFDLGAHVKVRHEWWGVIIEMDSEAVHALIASGGACAILLASIGVTAMVAGIIGGVMGIIKAFDRGRGVNVYVTWVGVHWYTPR